MNKIILLLLFISTLFQIAYNCSCEYEKPMDSMCKADFISYVHVKGVTRLKNAYGIPYKQSRRGIRYYVDHLEVFKMPRKMIPSHRIYTPSNAQLCGMSNLKKGDKIYLMGKIEKKKTFLISICHSVNFHSMIKGKISEKDLQILRKKSYEPCEE
ncbi:Netrin domain and Proteinase inhibitor I35, tissue inhibitor of metalloproteinase family and Tissue inhibitor of metalloproteinases-like, OB-fold domain-containing protein [Strongyloides ratti]|uniref:Netrin domain and Proteinase inhibitor I35, tissue inhibitor of metalloproteinase family and Tissue inhibitor of metalloproteinases-like, OB-fold domain-containing protein n=1 Tax=Strongyloides ratti TaxID=34506 RepID=A0A090LQ09_STRRB|nr:Netrin domain and Proteinase inhibitor I35, tissue inhibitor of metalloproteinase family and Tissue inhibitor of metalloproteinases-like, OB-fold domain-containing protein [Strongyloides ratti]CEF70224.1 Netrin domain and Proteinase inhibitor I35, tissue inhibitor of metalloproteinase family and Tissue inhibitor of metalloproteinases-like, OB-fold domain-containing protein [Strongyloides ratti]